MGTRVFANILERIAAFFIDSLLITIFLILFSYVFRDSLMFLGENLWCISYLVFGVYFVFLDSKISRGQTIGKRVLGIKTSNKDKKTISLRSSLVRFFIFSLIFIFLKIVHLFILKFSIYYLALIISFLQVFLIV